MVYNVIRRPSPRAFGVLGHLSPPPLTPPLLTKIVNTVTYLKIPRSHPEGSKKEPYFDASESCVLYVKYRGFVAI